MGWVLAVSIVECSWSISVSSALLKIVYFFFMSCFRLK